MTILTVFYQLIMFSSLFQVNGKSIFDQLEDKDCDECIAIMKNLVGIIDTARL